MAATDADWGSLGDPDVFKGMPYPISPVTSSGQDPDEVRALMGINPAPSQQDLAARMRYEAAGAGGVTAGNVMAPARSVVSEGVPAAAAPSAPAGAGTPESGTQPDANWLTEDARQGLSGQLQAGQRLMDTGGGMVQDPKVAEAEQKTQADLAAAPNPQDYRPGFGTRVLRGLKGVGEGLAEGGLRGALLGGIDPGLVRGGTSYGAPTDAYDIALAANKRQTAVDQSNLADALNNFKTAQDLRAKQAATYNQAATAFGNAGKTSADVQNAQSRAAQLPIDQQKADAETQKAFDLSPEGKLKATQAQVDQRTQFANQMGMPSGVARTRYILTGEIGEPRQASAEEVEVNRVLQTFVREHGGKGPQTVADWQTIVAAARGGAPKADTQAQTNLRTAARVASERVKTLENNASRYGMLWSDQEKQQHQQELQQARNELNQIQSELTSGAPPAPAAANANPPATPIHAQGPPKVGEVRRYKGQDYKFDGSRWNLQARAKAG